MSRTSGGSLEADSASLAEWAATRPARHRAIGKTRALACQQIPEWESKLVVGHKVRQVAASLGVSKRTLDHWRRTVRGAPEADWPYLLIPRWSGRSSQQISAEAWEFFRNLILARHQPTVTDCWRRTCEAAAKRGWGSLPSVNTFRRRIGTDIDGREWISKRYGPETLARLLWSRRRER